MPHLVTRYLYKAPFALDAVGIDLPETDEAHPNKARWRGILTQVDMPSTRPPNGSDGHLVMIPRAVCEAALPGLIGMAVDLSDDLRNHAHQVKVGIITEAEIAGNDVYVGGILYEKDFPEEVATIRARKAQLGMSYEISSVSVDDVDADIWVLNGFVFTGAAILYKNAAAYQNTHIAAAAEETVMPDERSKILDELAKLSQQMTELKASGASEEDAAKMKEEADAAALAATKAEADAAAKKAEEDAAAAQAKAEADAAAEEDAQAELFATMLRAMASRGTQDAAKKDDGNMMHKMLGMLMRAMVYPGGAPLDAKHEDEAEDIALIKRMLKPGGMSAARQPADLTTKRLERDVETMKKTLEAQGELLTDAMQKMTGLITDVVASVKNLTTDANHGNNGGPVRKTMSATGEKFIGPFDLVASADEEKDRKEFTMEEIDAALDKTEMTAQQRMAKKLELQFSNRVKQA